MVKRFDPRAAAKGLAKNITEAQPGEKIIDIPVSRICPDPNQPRRRIDQKRAEALGLSIKVNGQENPIIVRPNPGENPPYMLVSGERRWLGCKLVGLKTVQGLIRNLSDEDAAAIFSSQMAENIAREDMELPDVVAGVAKEVELFGVAEAAERLGQPKSWVSKVSAIGKAGGCVAFAVESSYVQDIEAMYLLSRLLKKSPDAAQRIINSWADPDKRLGARKQVQTALTKFESVSEGHSPAPSEPKARGTAGSEVEHGHSGDDDLAPIRPLVIEDGNIAGGHEQADAGTERQALETLLGAKLGDVGAGRDMASQRKDGEPAGTGSPANVTRHASPLSPREERVSQANPTDDAKVEDGNAGLNGRPVLTCDRADYRGDLIVLHTSGGPLTFDRSILNVLDLAK